MFSPPLTSYIVQAWLWDSAGTDASHALGVAADPCAGSAPATPPAPAAGVYTAAVADRYAAAPPWRAIGATRAAGWTLLEVAAGGGVGVHGVKAMGGGEVNLNSQNLNSKS